jgi:hypothetical protein
MGASNHSIDSPSPIASSDKTCPAHHATALGGLVLVVVVDAVVPEQGLVTVAPRVVLGADVLVGVLNALLQRRHVVPVLPMLVPEVIGVDGGENQEGCYAAIIGVWG